MFKKTIIDSEGVKWNVTCNFMRIHLIKEACGFDFFDQGEKDDSGKVIRKSTAQRFSDGDISPSDAAWIINAPQAVKCGIRKEDFCERFEDLEIINASAEAITSFFQSLEKKEKEAQEAAQAGGVGPMSGDSPRLPESPTLVEQRCANSQ